MMKRKRNEHIGAVRMTLLVVVFVISSSLAVNGWAASESAAPEKITLSVGKSEIVDVAERVKSVSMDSKGIADYTLLSPRKILITGKAIGATRIVLRKEDQTVLRIMDVEVGSGLNELKVKIHELFPDEKDVRVTAVHDTITLSGTVSGSTNLSQILALAQGYAPRDRDGKPKVMNLLEVGGVHQVMLEVRVSEMSRSLMRRLGFNWNYISSSGSNFGISLLNNLTSGGWPGHPLTVTDPINMIFRFTGDGASWTFFIDALKDQGLTKVLAEPTLITLSGRPASFLAGGEYPIPVPQATGGGTTITIEYKTFGVGLNFTPTVLSSGKISMLVNPEVSELDFTNGVALQGYMIPSLTTRRVSTVVELGDGQSFAIAGLLRDDVREIVRKFPVLGDIPVLGALFRSSSFQKNETELVIIVTPRLVKPLDMAKQTLPTDSFVEPDDFEFYLLGSLEGRGKEEPLGAGTTPRSLRRGGGLEGDFGYLKP